LIDDKPQTIEGIWQIVANAKPDLVVVDHLRLVSADAQNEVIRLGIITQRLKEIAKKFHCAVLLLAQLNRKVENESDKRPQLADLRDSGQIEENADNVLMIYRENYYDNDKQTNGKQSDTEVLIRKFRDDVLNQKIELKFDTAAQWFE
jgi:replicative DNA helicase